MTENKSKEGVMTALKFLIYQSMIQLFIIGWLTARMNEYKDIWILLVAIAGAYLVSILLIEYGKKD